MVVLFYTVERERNKDGDYEMDDLEQVGGRKMCYKVTRTEFCPIQVEWTVFKSLKVGWAVVVLAFNPSTQEAEVDGSLSVSSVPAWPTEQVPGQAPKLYREILSQKNKETMKEKKNWPGGDGTTLL